MPRLVPVPIVSPLLAIAAYGLLAVAGASYATARLDQATKQQCAAQGWPAHQHQAHVDFCRTYLAKY